MNEKRTQRQINRYPTAQYPFELQQNKDWKHLSWENNQRRQRNHRLEKAFANVPEIPAHDENREKLNETENYQQNKHL